MNQLEEPMLHFVCFGASNSIGGNTVGASSMIGPIDQLNPEYRFVGECRFAGECTNLVPFYETCDHAKQERR